MLLHFLHALHWRQLSVSSWWKCMDMDSLLLSAACVNRQLQTTSVVHMWRQLPIHLCYIYFSTVKWKDGILIWNTDLCEKSSFKAYSQFLNAPFCECFFRSVCYECVLCFMNDNVCLVSVLWPVEIILRYVWSALVLWVSFGGHNNCKTKIHVVMQNVWVYDLRVYKKMD